jgi:membrane glycosyltransferase
MSGQSHIWIMIAIYTLLLAPKLIGAAVTLMQPGGLRRVGGLGRFASGFALEVIMAVLYAPILMIQQTRAVIGVAMGLKVDWLPQARDGHSYRVWDLARAHAVETVLGLLLWVGIAMGLMSLWLAPIALSLACAVPLSWLSARPARARWLATPQSLRAPQIRRAALRWQRRLDLAVKAFSIPAE